MVDQEFESKRESLEQKESKINNDEAPDLEEITTEIEKLPTPVKRIVQANLSMQRISTSIFSPIQEKITEIHITKILEIAEKDDERAFLDAQSERKYTLIYFILILVFFAGLTVFLVNKDVVVYQELLKLFIVFGGGFGSGITFKGYLDRKQK